MTVEEMRKEVFSLKANFAGIIEAWKDKTMLDYYSQDFPDLHDPSDDVLRVIKDETARILGDDIASATHSALQTQKWVNTADHHGLVNHPYFYATALARSHERVRSDAQVTVTLPFGGVSLGNDSFPRGFYFHDREMQEQRIFFKSLKDRRMPLYALLPIERDALVRERDRARSLPLTRSAHERLHNLFDAFLSDERVWNQDTYSAQLTAMNAVLWRTLFGDTRGDLVHLEMDSVVRRLLIDKHLVSNTEVFKLIFDPKWRDTFVTLLSGIPGSHDDESGTHLFWYIDTYAKTRRGLVISGETLTTREGDVVIPLTPESILEGLEDRTLMPSTALALIILHGVEKLACGGGPSQLQYLSETMRQWQKLLEQNNISTNTPTSQIWCEACSLFKVTHDTDPQQKNATIIDLFLYGENHADITDTALASTPISVLTDAMMPILYELFTREKAEDAPISDIASLRVI